MICCSSRPGKDPWARIYGSESTVLNSRLLALEAFSSPEQLKIMLMTMIITVIITTITIKARSFGGGGSKEEGINLLPIHPGWPLAQVAPLAPAAVCASCR